MPPEKGTVLASSALQGTFGAFSQLAPLLVLECCGFVDARKRVILGNREIEEGAQRLPPLLDVKDQQPLRRERRLHHLIVPSKDGLAMRPIALPIAKGAGHELPAHR